MLLLVFMVDLIKFLNEYLLQLSLFIDLLLNLCLRFENLSQILLVNSFFFLFLGNILFILFRR